MKTFLSLGLLLVVVCSCRAMIFGRTDRVAKSEGREIEESCLNHADEGRCQFYQCFEDRLPCGRDWYMLRHGLFYCNRMERMMENLPEQAQNFLRDSQRCLMQTLKESYRTNVLSCHDLEHDAVDAISTCFIDNGFCTVMRGNYAQLFELYETRDLFSAGASKVWREIVSLVTQCGGERLEDIGSEAQRTISDAMNDVANSMRDFAGSFRDRIGNMFDLRKK